MQSSKTRRHATSRASTNALLIAAITAAPTLIVTGCGDAGDVREVQADRPAAPAISLEAAVIGGDDHAVRDHIIAGTPVNTQNMAGDTPLSIAAAMGRTYAAEVLVGAGADLETKNSAGATPLFNAAFFCHLGIVRLLIDAGADTGTTDQFGTPIRQIMEMPWAQAEPIYVAVHDAIGIPLDAARIESTRPRIAEMLR
ncbi:MAG: ankyrin repeat domain-containing protein [Planctomycetota bacterium]